VRGKGNKDRVVPIELELANNISRYLTLREEMMTQIHALQPDREMPAKLLITSKGKAVTGDVIYAIVERYMHPVSNADRTSPHVFRHTFATHMLNEGADISAIKELLGHSSLASTEIYTHVSREYLKETYKHAHPRAHKK
jgi:integrase/recombinase XerC